jgi:hypothetical protein
MKIFKSSWPFSTLNRVVYKCQLKYQKLVGVDCLMKHMVLNRCQNLQKYRRKVMTPIMEYLH